MPDIRDVPCTSCCDGYFLQHTCEAPDYCPCDHTHLHLHLQFDRRPVPGSRGHRPVPGSRGHRPVPSEWDSPGAVLVPPPGPSVVARGPRRATPVVFYGGRLHGTRMYLQLDRLPRALTIGANGQLYTRLDDPDTGEWLGAYIHEVTPDTQEPQHHAEDVHGEVRGRVPLLWRGRRWLRGLLRHE